MDLCPNRHDTEAFRRRGPLFLVVWLLALAFAGNLLGQSISTLSGWVREAEQSQAESVRQIAKLEAEIRALQAKVTGESDARRRFTWETDLKVKKSLLAHERSVLAGTATRLAAQRNALQRAQDRETQSARPDSSAGGATPRTGARFPPTTGYPTGIGSSPTAGGVCGHCGGLHSRDIDCTTASLDAIQRAEAGPVSPGTRRDPPPAAASGPDTFRAARPRTPTRSNELPTADDLGGDVVASESGPPPKLNLSLPAFSAPNQAPLPNAAPFGGYEPAPVFADNPPPAAGSSAGAKSGSIEWTFGPPPKQPSFIYVEGIPVINYPPDEAPPARLDMPRRYSGPKPFNTPDPSPKNPLQAAAAFAEAVELTDEELARRGLKYEELDPSLRLEKEMGYDRRAERRAILGLPPKTAAPSAPAPTVEKSAAPLPKR
jgi:hypothetical protein